MKRRPFRLQGPVPGEISGIWIDEASSLAVGDAMLHGTGFVIFDPTGLRHVDRADVYRKVDA